MFGVSDGLASNVVARFSVSPAARPTSSVVRLAGLAGLIAGSFSMAVGEYLSVSAQVELAERELRLERHELIQTRQGKGGVGAALRVAGREGGDGRGSRDGVDGRHRSGVGSARPRGIGVDPDKLGSPIAAVASFFSFVLGALAALIPWLGGTGGAGPREVSSLVLAATGAVIVGVVLA